MKRLHVLTAAGFGVVAYLALSTSNWSTAQQDLNQVPGNRWEYKVVEVGANASDLEHTLNEVARQDWELADVAGNVESVSAQLPTKTKLLATFKRMKQPEAAQKKAVRPLEPFRQEKK